MAIDPVTTCAYAILGLTMKEGSTRCSLTFTVPTPFRNLPHNQSHRSTTTCVDETLDNASIRRI